MRVTVTIITSANECCDLAAITTPFFKQLNDPYIPRSFIPMLATHDQNRQGLNQNTIALALLVHRRDLDTY